MTISLCCLKKTNKACACCRVPGEHFFDQVIDEMAVAAAQVGQGLLRIGVPLQGKRRQLQSGDPALGAVLEGGHSLGREIEPHHSHQKGVGFFDAELHVRGAYLAALPACVHAGNVEPGGMAFSPSAPPGMRLRSCAFKCPGV